MSQEDELQIVPDSEIPALLACLKSFRPLTVHAYNFIESLVKWKKKVPVIDIAIVTPNGGYKCGAVFFYVRGFNHLVCSAFAWTKEGSESLRKSLLTTKLFQGVEYKNVWFTCMTYEVWSIIEPVLPELLQDKRYPKLGHDKILWLPAEEVAKFNIGIPEGMQLRDLNKEHAEMIDSAWAYRSEGTKDLIAMMTWVNFGKGLFNSEGKLVAWAFYWFFGALGIVHTAEDERRKGYGKVVVKAVCKEMGSRGIDVHLNIVEGNTTSEAFFTSLGFKHAFNCVWASLSVNLEK